jgi:hypothetical protein
MRSAPTELSIACSNAAGSALVICASVAAAFNGAWI